MSNLEELAQLVTAMRVAQNEYFRTRSSIALNVARDYERRVDDVLGKILRGDRPEPAGQPQLFETPLPKG